jgi:hypothetical protein
VSGPDASRPLRSLKEALRKFLKIRNLRELLDC